MTSKQNSLYWREWGAVHKTDPSIDRHELHIRALGRDKSHLLFSNLDLDKVLAEFRAITKPGSLDAQLRQLNQTKTRLIWKITIEQAKLLAVCLKPSIDSSGLGIGDQIRADHYILQIIRDQFPVRDSRERMEQSIHPSIHSSAPADPLRSTLHALAPTELEHLRSTLAARINTLRRERGLTIHDMTTLAGLQCNCSRCAGRASVPASRDLAESNAPF